MTVRPLPLLALLAAILPACGLPRPSGGEPAVGLAAIERGPQRLLLTVVIANPGNDPLLLARRPGILTAAELAQGDRRIPGRRLPLRPRTVPADRYAVLAGETASLRLAFADPGLEAGEAAELRLTGTRAGIARTWTIPIPPAGR